MARRAACGAGAAMLFAWSPAAATETPRITVTPHNGLADGQVVRIEGTGWPAPFESNDQQYTAAQCKGSSGNPGDRCGNFQSIDKSAISAGGAFAIDYAVRRTFRNYADTVTHTCSEPGDCHVLVFYIHIAAHPTVREATAPIAFAAAAPK